MKRLLLLAGLLVLPLSALSAQRAEAFGWWGGDCDCGPSPRYGGAYYSSFGPGYYDYEPRYLRLRPQRRYYTLDPWWHDPYWEPRRRRGGVRIIF